MNDPTRTSRPSRRSRAWLFWLGGSLLAGAYLTSVMLDEKADRTVFLPGKTSDGHYQIELDCQSCHAEAFTNQDAMQAACERCHLSELQAVNDSHPRSKFTDPRNADRVAKLDARFCVTCHVEHRPDATVAMGVTLPVDYCIRCHEDVAEDRPSHEGMAFDTCADGGCHNFHDNRSLYEDFLTRSLDQPDHLPEARVSELSHREPAGPALDLSAADAPAGHGLSPDELAAWARSGHGSGGVNCSGCHGQSHDDYRSVSATTCEGCHESQTQSFRLGRHGMRTGQALSPMTTDRARRPMLPETRGAMISCNSCHGSHSYDTRRAAVDSCLTCHDDDHSKAYLKSPHARAWWAETLGGAPSGSGVSCATCHLPRHRDETGATLVQHNQNDNLRPNEKMVRTVCSNCHGVGYSLDALSDPELVRDNFNRPPSKQTASLDMVRARTAH